MANEEYTRPELLTTPADLQTKPGRSSLILIDTSPAPLKAFLAMIAHVFEMRGVDLEKEVVFYDDNSGVRAARGLWFLEYFGHQNVHVLDGGIQAWIESGYPVPTE